MKLKDILWRLGLLKQFNKAVAEEAQKEYSWYKLRCHLCEQILDVSSDSEYGAVQSALYYFNWAYFEEEIVPGFVKWKYLCGECK